VARLARPKKKLATVGTNLKLMLADNDELTRAALMGYDRFCNSYQR
jgi:hypothetical protein